MPPIAIAAGMLLDGTTLDMNSSSQIQADKSNMAFAAVAMSGAYSDLTGKPTIPAAQVNSDWSAVSGVTQILNKPSLATVASTGSYSDLSNKPTIPATQVNSDWNSISGVSQILNKPSIPATQIQSDWNQATTSSLDYIKNKPTIPASQVNSDWNSSSGVSQILNKPTINTQSFSTPTRSLNTSYQVSTTQNAVVSYSVDISASISLTAGTTGTVYLRYADDSGHTTNVKEVCRFVCGNTGTLTIGLALTQTNTAQLSGMIPAGKYGKLVTENTAGTPTFTYRSGQEVLI